MTASRPPLASFRLPDCFPRYFSALFCKILLSGVAVICVVTERSLLEGALRDNPNNDYVGD